nr:transposase [Ornithinimicrobium sediminis]
MNNQIEALGQVVAEHFGRHRDADIYTSLPGLGVILGARILGEFGDDPHRYADAKGRKAYAGTAPITRATGRRSQSVGCPCPELFPALQVGAQHEQPDDVAHVPLMSFRVVMPSSGARGCGGLIGDADKFERPGERLDEVPCRAPSGIRQNGE